MRRKARGGFVLKKLIGIGVAAMLGAAPAEAQTICQHIGNGTFCDNGLSSQKICNTTFYSNGVTRQDIGNTSFYDGNGAAIPPVGNPRPYPCQGFRCRAGEPGGARN